MPIRVKIDVPFLYQRSRYPLRLFPGQDCKPPRCRRVCSSQTHYIFYLNSHTHTVDSGHQLGNSLAVLRQYAALGVRYVTLTHGCHNAFADSAGIYYPSPLPLHHGLSPIGRTLIKELNRLGVLVDVSHTSDDTTRQVIETSEAPIIWSHSSARGVWDVPRNVPDDILKLIGTGKGKRDAVVQVSG